ERGGQQVPHLAGPQGYEDENEVGEARQRQESLAGPPAKSIRQTQHREHKAWEGEDVDQIGDDLSEILQVPLHGERKCVGNRSARARRCFDSSCEEGQVGEISRRLNEESAAGAECYQRCKNPRAPRPPPPGVAPIVSGQAISPWRRER